MKMKIAIVDDYDDIRELIRFSVEGNYNAEIFEFSSGNSLIEFIKSKNKFDLIISDMNMPNGSGIDVYNFLKSHSEFSTPLIVLSGDSLEHHPAFSGGLKLAFAPKPFTDEDLSRAISSLRIQENLSQMITLYIPVSIYLLQKVNDIRVPLFVKINDQKYVKLTADESKFTEEDIEKYQSKNVTHLYIESIFADEFINEFRQKVASADAWNSVDLENTNVLSLNTELMKSLADGMGWTEKVLSLAKENVEKALVLAKGNRSLQKVLNQFHKIERFGYADHCVLLTLVNMSLAEALGLNTPENLRSLTFASMLHDAALSDNVFIQKEKYLTQISKKENLTSNEVKEVLAHPSKAAEICRKWSICPKEVEEIVFNHHEKSDGQGFPLSKKPENVNLLSAQFIIAEDFVGYFIEHLGKPNLDSWVEERKSRYTVGNFLAAYNKLSELICHRGASAA